MSETYEPGELFVYMNGDRWELGEVKCSNNTGTGYFCWYSTGDTAANTPTSHMHKLANAGWSHIEKLREERDALDHLTDVLNDSNDGLLAENEKLRELLDYITPIAWYAASENERDRMRELGVEV